MDCEAQAQDPLQTQDSLNISTTCTEQSSTALDSISPAPPAPADGESYTTAELTALFNSLETRLTGFAEALLGVGECLDSLQTQIKELRDSRGKSNARKDKESDSDSEGEVEHKEQTPEGVGIDEHGAGAEGNDSLGVDSVEEERKVIDGPRTVNTETDADENGLGNMISGFVFGNDEPKESAS
ncbi:hypothetical protein CBER1_04705 [Cercospora berteroae]|uniref:Uncharacterized protein n=1 Tax=Cercospora berteroae TaxID=357750 RepID=A0A2S6BR58_9PEZI|nr:hypothetical protein CBER1_04705 [Cercospora berteroae]